MDNFLKTNLIGSRCISSLEVFIKDPYAFFSKSDKHPDPRLTVAILDIVLVSDLSKEGNVIPLALPSPVLSLAILSSLIGSLLEPPLHRISPHPQA